MNNRKKVLSVLSLFICLAFLTTLTSCSKNGIDGTYYSSEGTDKIVINDKQGNWYALESTNSWFNTSDTDADYTVDKILLNFDTDKKTVNVSGTIIPYSLKDGKLEIDNTTFYQENSEKGRNYKNIYENKDKDNND